MVGEVLMTILITYKDNLDMNQQSPEFWDNL